MKTIASILVVDDEPEVLDCIEVTLDGAGYQVLIARDGVQALGILESQPVDLILTDISMPRMNGYQLHEHVTKNPKWVTIPFLFLTARAQDSDIRYGKELGVDDYLTKPFTLIDLLAAVRGRLRRAQQLAGSVAQPKVRPPGETGALVLGHLRIDPDQHRVWMDEQTVKVSVREFQLLEYLVRRAEEVVPLQDLIKITHNLETNHAEASALLRPLIRSLRRKLGYPAGEMGCIVSVRGVGYQLIPPSD
jgi:DNA-binding response OmpR family regulator